MLPILFLISIDWVMKKITDSKRGITWSIYTTLEDLDFADDIALLSSRHSDMKKKRLKDSTTLQPARTPTECKQNGRNEI